MNTHHGLVGALPSGDPVLKGGQCQSCGYIFYPYQTYGCERCGSTEITCRDITPNGRLISWATVYIHPDKRRPAPFTVGEVELDTGPVIRAILDTSVEVTGLSPDLEMTGCLAPASPDEDEDEAFRFRFTLKGDPA